MDPGKPAIVNGLRGPVSKREKTGDSWRYIEGIGKGGSIEGPKNHPTTRGESGGKPGDPDNATP